MRPIPPTMVHQLQAQAVRLADRPALWTRRGGTWVPLSWRGYATHVKHLALALIELGLRPGQAVCVIGFNRQEWVVSALGTMAAGGVPVGLYTTSSEAQLEYLIGHCEAPIVIVEDEALLAKVRAVAPRLPALKHVVLMDCGPSLPAGVLRFDELLARGAALPAAPFQERLEGLGPESLATIIYTSGTTGHPKGVMLTHRNLCWTAAALCEAAGLVDDEVLLSFLPLSHIAEQVCSMYGPLVAGLQVYFARSFETLGDDLREVRPTVFFGVPRVWERLKGKAEASIAQQPRARRQVLAWARGVTNRYHQTRLEHGQPPFHLTSQYLLAQRAVFGPLKARIGLDRCHVFATGAAPIGRDVLDFFSSIDLVVRELYGLSEVTGPASLNTPEATRLGTLGRPMSGVAVRIADDGEILVKGENVCAGYFRDPVATAALLHEGWLATGDVGELDRDGFLRVTGRKKEIIVTSGGKKTSPATLEALLKAVAPIGQAVVIGDARPWLVAVLTLDAEQVPQVATAHGFPAQPTSLSRDEAFLTWLAARIDEAVNAKVSRFEAIKRFVVLPHDFTIEGGELTSTLKVKRRAVEAKYAALIDGLYAPGATSAAQRQPAYARFSIAT